MSSALKAQEDPVKKRKEIAQRLKVVTLFVLLISGGFAVYDSRAFYSGYLKRCEETPDRPECAFVKPSKPAPRPNLGILMDYANGKWAIQLERVDLKTANENSARLTAAGAEPRLIKVIGRKKAVYYCIQLGRFRTKKDAADAGNQLKIKGLVPSFVISEYQEVSR